MHIRIHLEFVVCMYFRVYGIALRQFEVLDMDMFYISYFIVLCIDNDFVA